MIVAASFFLKVFKHDCVSSLYLVPGIVLDQLVSNNYTMINETPAPGCIEINTPKTSVARSIILIVHANIKYFVAKV